MGQCTGKTVKKLTYKSLQQYWKEPADTERLANIVLPKLAFQGILANFKIINCRYETISVKVEIKEVDTFLLRSKIVKQNKSANWSFKHKFQFEMTQFELRKSFVEIFLQDGSENAIGTLKLNLYLVSTGPYHQNFAINLKNGETSRIYFDLKISQIIEIELDSIRAEIDPFTKHPGQKFNYSIKTIVGHNTAFNVSAPSYTVKVNLDDKQNSQQQISQIPPVLKRKNTFKSALKQIPEGKNLVWTKDDHLAMPSIAMKTLVSQLNHCYFQLLFWKIYDKNETEVQKGEQIPQLFGQCYVALHKIFDIEPSTRQCETEKAAEMQVKEERTFTSQDKLWNHGKQIGKGFFKFVVTSDKYIKQMQVMVRTEEGIVKNSPQFFISNERGNNSANSPQLTELTKITQQIQQNAVQLDRIMSNENENNQPNIQSRKVKVNIERLLQRTLSLLQKSYTNNRIIYSYNSTEQLMRAQQLFLSIGFKTLDYLEEQDVHITDLCWQILVGLLERGQFMLDNIGFDQKQKDKIKQYTNSNINNLYNNNNRSISDKNINNNNSSNSNSNNSSFTKVNVNKNKSKIKDAKLERKIQIALTYNEFLSKLLKMAVDSLNMKGLQLQRNFAQVFSAYAYFRIPSFRNAILQAITRQNDPQLPEWRSIEFSLQEDIDYDELKQEVNTFTALFDWSNNFHKCIQHMERYQIGNAEINQVLLREDWKFRMSKRGITFFQFIKCWVEYVESIVIKPKDIQWKYFPGYNKLLKCFLAQMKKRPILQYPDILKASLYKLLANQKLLNPIIYIIFNKANIYQPLTVIRAIVFISQIFTVLCQKDKKIPATFNYFHFYQGIKIVLESQFSFAISKTIVMLYNYYKIFSLEFRRNISMLLLGKIFYKLFLHWSFNVRDVFYHLVMRLYQQTLRANNEFHDNSNICQQEVNEEIRSRYIKLLETLEKAESYHRENKKNFKFFQKNLHKKLKNKLADKKRNTLKPRSHSFQSQYFPQTDISPTIYFNRTESPMNGFFNYHTQTTRVQSQIQKPMIKLHNKPQKIQKQEQIKVLHKKSTLNFQHKIYDNTQGQKILMKSSINDNYGQYVQSDFQIGTLQTNLLEYIETAMKQFKKTNELFAKNFSNKNWELPKIQMEMSLDSREIRPEKIDDW